MPGADGGLWLPTPAPPGPGNDDITDITRPWTSSVNM